MVPRSVPATALVALLALWGPSAAAQMVVPADPAVACACDTHADRAALLDELESLIRAAERYQAASPDFLADLNTLLTRERIALRTLEEIHSFPLPQPGVITVTPDAGVAGVPVPGAVAPRVFLRDDFADGNFTDGPAWAVRQGAWRIDPLHGLRVAPQAADAAPALTINDLIAAVLSGQPPRLPDAASGGAPAPQAALIDLRAPIGNAFDLGATVQDHAGTGAAHFLIHQSGREWPGYRLEMIPGPAPRLRLARRGRDGYLDLAVANAPALETGRPVSVRWRRDQDGVMTVALDGQILLEARDITFQGDWTGFIFFNARGDMSLKRIEVTEPAP